MIAVGLGDAPAARRRRGASARAVAVQWHNSTRARALNTGSRDCASCARVVRRPMRRRSIRVSSWRRALAARARGARALQ
jgi:hypothetical protein